jgi:hypothetical protein
VCVYVCLCDGYGVCGVVVCACGLLWFELCVCSVRCCVCVCVVCCRVRVCGVLWFELCVCLWGVCVCRNRVSNPNLT